jgi:hypothetical protein
MQASILLLRETTVIREFWRLNRPRNCMWERERGRERGLRQFLHSFCERQWWSESQRQDQTEKIARERAREEGSEDWGDFFARNNGDLRVSTAKSNGNYVRERERRGVRTQAIFLLFLRETMVIRKLLRQNQTQNRVITIFCCAQQNQIHGGNHTL